MFTWYFQRHSTTELGSYSASKRSNLARGPIGPSPEPRWQRSENTGSLGQPCISICPPLTIPRRWAGITSTHSWYVVCMYLRLFVCSGVCMLVCSGVCTCVMLSVCVWCCMFLCDTLAGASNVALNHYLLHWMPDAT